MAGVTKGSAANSSAGSQVPFCSNSLITVKLQTTTQGKIWSFSVLLLSQLDTSDTTQWKPFLHICM